MHPSMRYLRLLINKTVVKTNKTPWQKVKTNKTPWQKVNLATLVSKANFVVNVVDLERCAKQCASYCT